MDKTETIQISKLGRAYTFYSVHTFCFSIPLNIGECQKIWQVSRQFALCHVGSATADSLNSVSLK